jgi:hypothetical protein
MILFKAIKSDVPIAYGLSMSNAIAKFYNGTLLQEKSLIGLAPVGHTKINTRGLYNKTLRISIVLTPK